MIALIFIYSCGKSLSDAEVIEKVKGRLSELGGYKEVKVINDYGDKTLYVSKIDCLTHIHRRWRGHQFNAGLCLYYHLLEVISEISSKNDTIFQVELEMRTEDSSLSWKSKISDYRLYTRNKISLFLI